LWFRGEDTTGAGGSYLGRRGSGNGGSFSSVWRREPDGSWQIIFDKGCP
jgi:ketosteroid isomerase-like protein